ncbi:MAG: hypothetical protein ACAI44_17965, partial [Candidatus Sericytochromatia bacterium]
MQIVTTQPTTQTSETLTRQEKQDVRKQEKAQKAEQKVADKQAKDELKLSDSKKGAVSSATPLFAPQSEQNAARTFLNGFSQGAFEPGRSVNDQLINLKTSHDQVDQAQSANYTGSANAFGVQPSAASDELYQLLNEYKDHPYFSDLGDNPSEADLQAYFEKNIFKVAHGFGRDVDDYLDTGRVNLDDLGGIKSLSGLNQTFYDSLAAQPAVQAALGPNPSQAQLDAYVDQNYLAIAQMLGRDLGSNYEGFVSLIGDVNAFSVLNDRGGVCSDIHAAITAFHTAQGKEAYVLMSSGNDYAHVISVFRGDDGKWVIQNYANIVETGITTLEELYDKVMPENREIKLWKVNDDGSLRQVVTDHLTATGRAERRFRAEAGVGDFSPWYAQEGISVGTDGVSVYKDGLYAGVKPAEGEAAIGYYTRVEKGGKDQIRGLAIEGQEGTNEAGYHREHLDAKYESEKRWVTEDTFGREHFSVYAGAQGAMAAPAYWSEEGVAAEERDPLARIGVSYARNQSKVYGEQKLKFELGYDAKATGTASASVYDPVNFQTAGLMYSDAGIEAKLITGAFYQPSRDLMVRAGLASGVDLGKIDG